MACQASQPRTSTARPSSSSAAGHRSFAGGSGSLQKLRPPADPRPGHQVRGHRDRRRGDRPAGRGGGAPGHDGAPRRPVVPRPGARRCLRTGRGRGSIGSAGRVERADDRDETPRRPAVGVSGALHRSRRSRSRRSPAAPLDFRRRSVPSGASTGGARPGRPAWRPTSTWPADASSTPGRSAASARASVTREWRARPVGRMSPVVRAGLTTGERERTNPAYRIG